jgi:hypothetical protein
MLPVSAVSNYSINADTDTSFSLLLKSFENTSFWNFGHFHFVIVLIGFNCTSRFRKSMWSNRAFVGYCGFILAVLAWIVLFVRDESSNSWALGFFNVQPGIPFLFRFVQLVFVCIHLVMAVAWERFWQRFFHPPFKLSDSDFTLDRLL